VKQADPALAQLQCRPTSITCSWLTCPYYFYSILSFYSFLYIKARANLYSWPVHVGSLFRSHNRVLTVENGSHLFWRLAALQSIPDQVCHVACSRCRKQSSIFPPLCHGASTHIGIYFFRTVCIIRLTVESPHHCCRAEPSMLALDSSRFLSPCAPGSLFLIPSTECTSLLMQMLECARCKLFKNLCPLRLNVSWVMLYSLKVEEGSRASCCWIFYGLDPFIE
jgi:hypothetical protein